MRPDRVRRRRDAGMRSWRAILRPNRVELTAAAILGVVMVAIVGAVVARLMLFDIPAECFGPESLNASGTCVQFRGDLFAYGEFAVSFGPAATITTLVVPILAAMVLGLAVVGRELEQQTTNFAWAIAPSRRRWLGSRLLPVLILLTAIGLIGGGLGDVLLGLRAPYVDAWRNFEGLGARGPAIAGSALLVFGISLLVGSLVGRQLPALLISGAVVGAGIYGVNAVGDAWLQGDAEVATYDEIDPGARSFDSMVRTRAGEIVAWEDAYLRFGSEVDQIGTGEIGSGDTGTAKNGLTVVTRYVPGERYPVAVARLTMLLTLVGALGTALTFAVVHRRRPY
jgi:ABC-type transport system involved in multi-copper enzyme maturation permease subunit